MDYDQHILSAIADGKIYVNFSAENNQYRVITKERMLIFGSQGVEISHRFDDPTQLETSTLAALTTVREDHNILFDFGTIYHSSIDAKLWRFAYKFKAPYLVQPENLWVLYQHTITGKQTIVELPVVKLFRPEDKIHFELWCD